MIVTDLETVDGRGRLDVLCYRGAEYILRQVEQSHGLAGIWENAKPLVNQAIVQGISGIEIPVELKMILGIVQANWGRNVKPDQTG